MSSRIVTVIRSARDLKPGDIVELQYDYSPKKRYMIVSVARSKKKGYFISTQVNKLLCCYEIVETMPKLIILLNTLYKDEKRCSYHGSPALLNLVFGSDNFRTLNFENIRGLKEFYIPEIITTKQIK